MAYTIMPTLPLSMAKGFHKSWNFNTVLQKVAAGRGNASVSLTPYALWDMEVDLDHITGNEALVSSTVAAFMGTMMACQGRNQLFLFTDPQDSSISYANSGMLNVTTGAAAPMGTAGDGVSTQFQLARSIGGVAWDVIQNLNGSATVKVNGTVVTAVSISSTGVATFTSAPASGATLQWTGSFYFLCRFSEDTIDATRSYTTNSGTDQWDFISIKFSSEFV